MGAAPHVSRAATRHRWAPSSWGRHRGRALPAPAGDASGTCWRLTRMRVHVAKRPRIASTRTSAGARCAAASGCRARHRSRPASASSFFCGGQSRSADAWRCVCGRVARAPVRRAASRIAAARGHRPVPPFHAAPTTPGDGSIEHRIAVDTRMTIADSAEPGRHRDQREVFRLTVPDLFPRQRRRHARVRPGRTE